MKKKPRPARTNPIATGGTLKTWSNPRWQSQKSWPNFGELNLSGVTNFNQIMREYQVVWKIKSRPVGNRIRK